jgi:hypothetical protein
MANRNDAGMTFISEPTIGTSVVLLRAVRTDVRTLIAEVKAIRRELSIVGSIAEALAQAKDVDVDEWRDDDGESD